MSSKGNIDKDMIFYGIIFLILVMGAVAAVYQNEIPIAVYFGFNIFAFGMVISELVKQLHRTFGSLLLFISIGLSVIIPINIESTEIMTRYNYFLPFAAIAISLCIFDIKEKFIAIKNDREEA
ncbi:hypothetical protein [Ornithinibacillus halotolerans]|nr:hypothetical protein [Ornithinibacillus halotolerans]